MVGRDQPLCEGDHRRIPEAVSQLLHAVIPLAFAAESSVFTIFVIYRDEGVHVSDQCCVCIFVVLPADKPSLYYSETFIEEG